jgi:putative phosphoesterase
MKRIGILSDTHGIVPNQVYEFFKDCDEIWHAGDVGNADVLTELQAFKPLRAVYGNIDGGVMRRIYHESNCFEVDGCKVLMMHIGGYPRNYSPKALQLIHGARPKIFVSGHSHILKVIYDPIYDLLHINPGGAGIYGIHRVRTAVRFDIEAGEIKNMEIGEWNK